MPHDLIHTAALASCLLLASCGSATDDAAQESLGTSTQALGVPAGHRSGTIEWVNGKCVTASGGFYDGGAITLSNCSGQYSNPSNATNSQAFRYERVNSTIRALMTPAPLVIDFPSWGSTGSALQLWGPTYTASQRWSLNNGKWISGGYCLDVPNGNFAQGQELQFWSCWDTPNQKWATFFDGSIRPMSNWGLCVDNANSSIVNGNSIRLWPCNGSSAQRWYPLPQGMVSGNGSNKCMDRDISGGGGNGSRAMLYDCTGGANQYLYFAGQIRGETGYCMDVRDGNPNNGAILQGWTCLANNFNQLFVYYP